MYDATGVRLHAGRQAEVSLLLHLFFVPFFYFVMRHLSSGILISGV